jgi:hypothetical protein
LLDVLFLSPARFRAKPQVGVACVMTWRELARYLSRPTVGDAKDKAGAWSPALYRANVRRKTALMRAHAIVVDVDDAGDVDRVADALSAYQAIVHATFSSTVEAPRCRIVLALAEPIDANAYERTHAVVRTHLRAAGILADDGAKDASRVSYAPVVRPGAVYRFREVDGSPLDARAVLTKQPPAPMRAPPRFLPAPERGDAYVRAALRRAASNVATSDPGGRHHALLREAFALARFSLSHEEIERALLPAFVTTAGEARQREGERTIRDAVRARRGAQ